MTDSTTDVRATRLYEGLFLLSQQTAAAGLSESLNCIQQILERAAAEIVALGKWDERKLAYTIHGQKRGTYIHALFRVEGVKVANIERDCNLGDDVTRVLITAADYFGETEIELAKQDAARSVDEAALTASPAESSELEAEAAAEPATEAETVED